MAILVACFRPPQLSRPSSRLSRDGSQGDDGVVGVGCSRFYEYMILGSAALYFVYLCVAVMPGLHSESSRAARGVRAIERGFLVAMASDAYARIQVVPRVADRVRAVAKSLALHDKAQ